MVGAEGPDEAEIFNLSNVFIYLYLIPFFSFLVFIIRKA